MKWHKFPDELPEDERTCLVILKEDGEEEYYLDVGQYAYSQKHEEKKFIVSNYDYTYEEGLDNVQHWTYVDLPSPFVDEIFGMKNGTVTSGINKVLGVA